MSEIPETVMETARWIAADQCGADSQCAYPGPCTCRDQIAQAILADRQRDQWQDISTAPRDGKTILAYFPLEGLGDDWCRVMPVFFAKSMEPRPWIFAGRAASSYGEGPTHWQPLPPAPKGGE